MSVPRVLSIAGTDPTGGAGVQADLKSIGALGGYGMAVVTALVAQNTRGVRSIHVPPAAFLSEQLRAVSDDVALDAVKIGMLHSRALVETVDDWLHDVAPPIVVLDPVMVATSGDRLLDRAAEEAVRALCSRADLVTPNLAELAVLTGRAPAEDWRTALDQAHALHESSGAAVLVKGGHLAGGSSPDAIVADGAVHEVTGPRIATRSTHGTGCSLSSAMATLRASGLSWPDALTRAKAWLTGALAAADALQVGRGNGPVDHFHELRRAASWTDAAWQVTARVRADVDRCGFVQALGDGTLAEARFHRYLAQDALYLHGYSRVLAVAADLAPTDADRAFWGACAESALEEESRLHRERIGVATQDAASATLAYLGHLDSVAARGQYAEIVAAVLPCFWLYSDVGRRLRALSAPAHPYRDWLETYDDPAFADATKRAIAAAEAAAGAASVDERDSMTQVFVASMRLELAFFEAF
ncbi:bifunctional hydroxymethylpyrimidine kinase/phosphomethylpyrimidine kinase [Microbacterium sp. SS28]|uniref:bifunctional hydroxymethylpyrimidine kinase/phosphomethylpyrimidine kinase n=1 Tax=Microbacterium sp. SS28 TaxID=2919948 RepID=UPI001FA97963|nr:bifunctional hydroxymethylpyrimidine kinase/phosphomethylpyrimidine kinase [Microbacterium sp. SS28]